MDIVHASEIDELEYERFLDHLAAWPGTALAYHYPFYLRFLRVVAYPSSTLRFIIARDARGRLAGVVPGLHVRTARVDVWLSLAYFGPNAGALVPNGSASDGSSMVCALARAAAADARDRGCGSMTIYTPLGAGADPYHAGLGGVDFEMPRMSQWLRMPDDPESSPWPAKVRYYVRRASARGVTVRNVTNEAELDLLWDIYCQRCEERTIPVKPRDHIRTLFRTAGRHGIFLAAEQDARIVAGLICLMGGGVLSYYLPCARTEGRTLRPALLLLDRAVAIARRSGCRLLNFEGSPGVGGSVYQFKAECGGQPVPYRVLVKLLRPAVLDEYRVLTAAGLAAEAPHAFIVPFEALA